MHGRVRARTRYHGLEAWSWGPPSLSLGRKERAKPAACARARAPARGTSPCTCSQSSPPTGHRARSHSASSSLLGTRPSTRQCRPSQHNKSGLLQRSSHAAPCRRAITRGLLHLQCCCTALHCTAPTVNAAAASANRRQQVAPEPDAMATCRSRSLTMSAWCSSTDQGPTSPRSPPRSTRRCR